MMEISRNVRRITKNLINEGVPIDWLLKQFKTQNSYLFIREEEENRKNIIDYIINSCEELSRASYVRAFSNVKVSKELLQAIEESKKSSDMVLKAEVEFIEKFMEMVPVWAWSMVDRNMQYISFELIESEGDFNEICKMYTELTHLNEDENLPAKARIAFMQIPLMDQYRKKKLVRKFQKIEKKHIDDPEISAYIETFNLWYGCGNTGVYYVYIPKK